MTKLPKSEYAQLHLVLEPSITHAAKVKCVQDGVVMSRIIEKWLDLWVKGKLKTPELE